MNRGDALILSGSTGDLAGKKPLRFRLGQRLGVTMSVQAKRPGQGLTAQTVDLYVDFDVALGRVQEAYERLLADVIDRTHRLRGTIRGFSQPGNLHPQGRHHA